MGRAGMPGLGGRPEMERQSGRREGEILSGWKRINRSAPLGLFFEKR